MEDLVGPVTEVELEKGDALRGGYVRLKRVCSLMSLVYGEQKTMLKRGRHRPGSPPYRRHRLRPRRPARRSGCGRCF
jgi:hypothetical protein